MKGMAVKIKSEGLEAINKKAAGIDLGSRSHWVCCPSFPDGSVNVQEFSSDTASLCELADHLSKNEITSVAMESTGVYWIPLFELLTERGFEVILADTRLISRVPGRKTDMLDCQWIQRLHSCGLLNGAFRPGDDIVKFRAFVRMKNTLLSQKEDWLRRMQKELDQMNICVHHAVSDISGVTGMSILKAIANGERDPSRLSEYRDKRCKKTKKEIEKDLTGTWREEHIFNLKIGLEMYDCLAVRVLEVQNKIHELLEKISSGLKNDTVPVLPKKSKSRQIIKRGQEPMRQALYKMSGSDLTRIDGISTNIAEVILSEIGPDLSKFQTEKQFVSYLRLAPNMAVSGGKTLHGKKKKVICCNRVKAALRTAVSTISKSSSALGGYYRNVLFKKGTSIAMFATARKIAQYIYRMLRYGVDYIDIGIKEYEERCRTRRVRRLMYTAKDLGFKVEAISPSV